MVLLFTFFHFLCNLHIIILLKYLRCLLLVFLLVLLNHLCLLNFLNLYFRGIKKTSLPCSNAKSTVINVPLFFFASTTNNPFDIPLIILFLAGKFIFSGLVPIGYSEIIAPFVFKIF